MREADVEPPRSVTIKVEADQLLEVLTKRGYFEAPPSDKPRRLRADGTDDFTVHTGISSTDMRFGRLIVEIVRGGMVETYFLEGVVLKSKVSTRALNDALGEPGERGNLLENPTFRVGGAGWDDSPAVPPTSIQSGHDETR
jgi:hypothetical protein